MMKTFWTTVHTEKAHLDLNLNARPVDGIVMIVGRLFYHSYMPQLICVGTFLCSWRLRAPALVPGNWFVSLLGVAFIPGSEVEGDISPSLCLNEAARCWEKRRRSLDSSEEGHSRCCWQCPVCVDEHAFLCGCLLQSFQYLHISHDCVLCELA